MKKLIGMAILSALVFTSCSKNEQLDVKKDNIELNLQVGEQVSVDRYEIEGSNTGSDFKVINSFKASTKTEDSYQFTFTSNYKYLRIKSVDIDGKFSYSSVTKF